MFVLVECSSYKWIGGYIMGLLTNLLEVAVKVAVTPVYVPYKVCKTAIDIIEGKKSILPDLSDKERYLSGCNEREEDS